jgi:hypothetical protein
VFDLEIHLSDRPGELARFGRTLGQAGVSVEGGGMFVAAGTGVAHFLVADDRAALAALDAEGIPVVACREVLTVRLRQDQPGQLGALTDAMARAGVNIETLYSDHDHRLVLLVDDVGAATRVQAAWAAGPG